MGRGALTASDLLAACLDRIARREDAVRAWCHLDADGARAAARVLDGRGTQDADPGQPLFGLPVGVKDIIETHDLPTAYGSAAYLGHQSSVDAACVAGVRAAGGMVMGKTVTTEFAYFQPGKTTNPHNPDHTPGGSSSGSAAAVADFMVPLAFGTQTGGSVIRPAAFCGVVGYKATYGALPLFGVKALSHDLDTLGMFCREVADVHLMRAALVGAPTTGDDARPRVGLCKTYEWDQADGDSQAAVLAAAKNLEAAGAQLVDVDLPAPFAELVARQKEVMAQNAARDLAFEYHNHRDRLGRHIIALIEQGLDVSYPVYQAALSAAALARQSLTEIFSTVDALLCPSATGQAPKRGNGTGDPVFNRMWTLLGNPCVNLPGHRGATDLPVGVQAVGAMGRDEVLLSHCRWMERRIV